MSARRFELHRDIDVSGISGTGVVAEGIEFSDGIAVVATRIVFRPDTEGESQ